MPEPKPKRPEIVLATWGGKTGAEFFGDRIFPRMSGDLECDSMWLSFRVVDDESYAAWTMRNTISNIGLWIWWSTKDDNISVEFKAHEVHSATVRELEDIVAELRRLQKRIPARLHGQGYATYVCEVLKAAGIKRRVEYRGIGVKEENHPLQSCFAELTRLIASRSGKVAA